MKEKHQQLINNLNEVGTEISLELVKHFETHYEILNAHKRVLESDEPLNSLKLETIRTKKQIHYSLVKLIYNCGNRYLYLNETKTVDNISILKILISERLRIQRFIKLQPSTKRSNDSNYLVANKTLMFYLGQLINNLK